MLNQYNKPLSWVFNPNYRVLFHILFWILMYLDEFFSLIGITPRMEWEVYTDYITYELLGDLILVYVNLYLLIPYFLFRNKFWQYLLLTILSIAIFCVYNYMMLFSPEDYEGFPTHLFFIQIVMATLPILGTAVGIKVFKRYIQNQAYLKEVETSGLKTELAYLKQQINPHFLFNALNNIYVLSRKSPKETPDTILLLSDLLRYQLYDCSQEKVSLKGEIEYIKNYLELDSIRKDKLETKIKVEGSPNAIMIPPFLLLPFVENAVKHGISIDDKSSIEIFFNIKEEQLYFTIKNSKPPQKIQYEQGGIGLKNIERRLELLYDKNYTLNINDKSELYEVLLSVPLER